MRTLTFEPSDIRYDMCWSCATMLPTFVGGMPVFSLGQGEVDDHVALVKKLKSIGQLINPNRERGQNAVYETVAGGAIDLENAEYALLLRMVEAAVPVINVAISDRYQDTRNWLRALPVIVTSAAKE